MATVHQLFNAVRDMREVEVVCAGFVMPYSNASWTSDHNMNGRQIDYAMNAATDDCDDVYGITMTRGRWFDRSDDGAAYSPIVVNEQFVRDVFGDADPINKTAAGGSGSGGGESAARSAVRKLAEASGASSA